MDEQSLLKFFYIRVGNLVSSLLVTDTSDLLVIFFNNSGLVEATIKRDS